MNVLSSLYCGAGTEQVDGVVLQSISSTQYVNSICNIKLKTANDPFATQRFMINFEQLSISNCGVSLKFYFTSDSSGTAPVSNFY